MKSYMQLLKLASENIRSKRLGSLFRHFVEFYKSLFQLAVSLLACKSQFNRIFNPNAKINGRIKQQPFIIVRFVYNGHSWQSFPDPPIL